MVSPFLKLINFGTVRAAIGWSVLGGGPANCTLAVARSCLSDGLIWLLLLLLLRLESRSCLFCVDPLSAILLEYMESYLDQSWSQSRFFPLFINRQPLFGG